ncbi:MAG: sugar ABC transporter permease [Chloroflexi bacterium]|nr:sugar ABC transporter permease [Chloroflexota bacterium]
MPARASSVRTPTHHPRRRFQLHLSLSQREEITFYLFLIPWAIGFVLWTAGPMLASLILSFTRYDVITPPVFVGLDNYIKILKDELTWKALKATAYYTFGAVGVTVTGALTIATLLNQKLPLLSMWRTIYYLPVVTSGVAVALLWMWIFQPNFGLVNNLLWSWFHIKGPQWFFDPKWTIPTFIIMASWGVGGPMLIYLAAMQGVPTSLYEAAIIDGANAFQRYIHITLPMISPAIFFNVVLSIIGSFQVFTPAFVITQGGPQYASYFFVYHLYLYAFNYFEMGYASGLAWVLFIVILGFTLLVFRGGERWVYYETGGGA